MSGEQFCLRWNNFQSSILTNLESLKCDEDLVDVTLVCEGKSVKAHKLVLSACSSYFKNVFKENPCAHPVVILKGFTFADISSLVSFMYQGEVHIAQDKLESFLGTAELLEVRGLADVPSPNIVEFNNRNTEAKNPGPGHCTSPKGVENSSSTPQNPSLPFPAKNNIPSSSNQTFYETPESVQPLSSPIRNQTDIKSLHSAESATPPDSENGEGEDIEEWKNEESDWKVIPKEEPMESEGNDPLSLRERIPSEEASQPFDWQNLSASGSESSNQNLTIQNPGPRFLENMNSNMSIGATSQDRATCIPCPLCDKIISNKSNLTKHMKIRHSPGLTEEKCIPCGKVFKNKYSLKYHWYMYHRQVQ